MILDEKYKLVNEVAIPKLGLGTWCIDNDKVEQVVLDAFKIGYRHIDTASAYENEFGIGKAIKSSKIKRSEIFITSKIRAEMNSYTFAKINIEAMLKQLQTDYLDLVLIHSPQPWSEFKTGNYFKENIATWTALEDYYRSGKIKAIGVANFSKEDLQNIIDNCEIKPMVNQILCHVSNTPLDLIEFCKKNDILVEAYSPFGHGEILNNEELKKIASKYNVSVPQLCIRYCLQLGTLPLPKATSYEHILDNTKVDFEISSEDMEALINFKKIESYGEFDLFPCFGKNK